MEFRHIFFPFSLTRSLEEQKEKKTKNLLYMIKLSRNVLFLEKKLVICWAFKTITQLPVFTKETVKSSTEETPQVYFLGWKTELKYLRTRYQESKEHSIPLNAVVTPTLITKSRETRGTDMDWQHPWQKTIQVTPFLHFSLILGMDCSTIPLRCGCPPILGGSEECH